MMIHSFQPEYKEQALTLALSAYEKERNACPDLPDEDFKEAIRKQLEALQSSGHGAAVLNQQGHLLGFILFWPPRDGFFGNCRGAFAPFCGFAIAEGCDREKAASLLFESASQRMIGHGITSFSICIPAHDSELFHALTLLGFGARCADAVTRLNGKQPARPAEDVTCRELPREERLRVNALRMTLERHFVRAPIFMPADVEYLKRLLSEGRDTRLFAAEKDGKLIGFIELDTEGETFVTRMPCMLSICGTCFAPEARGTGAAEQLLNYMKKTLIEEGYQYLGVDCETLNPTALRFWGKHFSTYTFSFTRRIDERILDCEPKLDALFDSLPKV